ncbi:MAG: NAD-dependent epimerase/dehydratase family protein [Faecalibacterium sp.]
MARLRTLKTEETLPTPNTPYGISKLVAEKIHQIWQARDPARELTIVRPGIVYGKGEHGNMTRLYRGQKKGYFFMPVPEGHHQGVHLCQGVGALLQVPDAGSFLPRSRDL